MNTSSLFKPSEQTVRVIKAAQAAKILGGHAHASLGSALASHKKPEIRLIETGADYCDLEIVCGCGETTRVRCWNTPAEQAVAA